MIHAYSKLYLDSTQDILGHAFDWVANTCGEDLDVFFERFARSNISELFGSVCPRYAVGCNGAELVNFVMEDLGLPEYDKPHEFWGDWSPEYWAGWNLAYFQWRENLSFKQIQKRISVHKVLDLYLGWREDNPDDIADILKKTNEK